MALSGTPTDPDLSRTKPAIELPPGYLNEMSFLEEMRTFFYDDLAADQENRTAGTEDLQFLAGKQWDDEVRQRRENAKKPVLTINRLVAFVAQVLGSRRLNETEILFIPTNGGTKEVAELREGLTRSIQKQSRAFVAYDNALMGGVACGIGNFQLDLEWSADDVWVQEMRIKPILDHFSVIWDRMLTDGSGKDAEHCFVVDTMTQAQYRYNYPWATFSDMMPSNYVGSMTAMGGWFAADDVRIVTYWHMRTMRRTLAMLDDGSTVDITDERDPAILSKIMIRADGSPYVREVDRRFAQKYVCSGLDILEGPYNLPIDRVPVFRVPGWEVRIEKKTFRSGLIRFLKDPQRLHNYFRSTVAERLTKSPKNTWLASDAAVAGREAKWRDSHLSDDPLLIWNSEAGQKPEMQPPAQIEAAFMQQAELTNQDIKDVSNIHEANLGMPSNEVSGVAIQRRQQVSDTGTVIYHDNLDQAIEECGRVIDALIPVVYDTPRMIQVIGRNDAQPLMQIINSTNDPRSIDITAGKYGVAVTTGPTWATKREQQAESMYKMGTAMPEVFSIAADLIVEAQDWPGADKIAARLRRAVPPQLLGPDEMTPDMQAQAAASSQKQQSAQKVALAQESAQFMSTQSQTALNYARAQHYQAQTQIAPSQLQNESINVASEAAHREATAHAALLKP